MEYRLSIIVSREGKIFVAKGVEIELASQGRTIEEAIKNLREAFELWLKHAEPSELEVFDKLDSPVLTNVEVTV